MVLAPTAKVVFGSISFAIFWVLAVFPAVSLLPIGRTAGSLLGAVLMVISRVLTPAQAYAAVDLPILGLLFGTMVVGAFLERADMFKYLAKLLSWKSRGGKDLMCRICIVSAISSALFTNDTCCVVLTEFVLRTASHNNLPPQPFLLALASSANIGSSATPIGNPQNLVIAVQSGISFGEFLLGVLPAMLVGVTLNIIILLCYFWKSLLSSAAAENDQEEEEEEAVPVPVPELMLAEDGTVASPTMFHPNSTLVSRELQTTSAASDDRTVVIQNSRTSTGAEKDTAPVGVDSARDSEVQAQEEDVIRNESRMNTSPALEGVRPAPLQKADSRSGKRWKKLLWKISVYLVTLGMLVSLLMGLDMSWTALTAALALVVLDFKDARPCLEKVRTRYDQLTN